MSLTLQQCKDKVARDCGYQSFNQMCGMVGQTHEYIQQKHDEVSELLQAVGCGGIESK